MTEWLNYHHLLYFWTVAREGGLGPASKALRLSRPTLSGQIAALEDRLGHELFVRTGKRLELTEMGRLVQGYAETIFTTGRELLDAVKGNVGGPPALTVGVVDVVPKLIVRRLLQPALHLEQPIRLVCHEDTYDRLLAQLASHELDLVISDAPIPAGSRVRAFNHVLGESGLTFFGTEAHTGLRRRFPASLEGAPMLLPLVGAPIRRALDTWFSAIGVVPRIVAEFEDSALLKVFGSDGLGVFVAPTAVEGAVRDQYGVSVIGRAPDVVERFFAISAERKLRHPAVVAISEAARLDVFA
jgi:LysR family transcriptional activator of nhaA